MAAIPIVATLLSVSDLLRTLDATGGGGFTVPFPTGLPTLWTYVSVPNPPVGGGDPGASVLSGVPLLIVGILITAALEAGFLGTIASRITGNGDSFVENVYQYTIRIVGVNLLRVAVTLLATPIVLVSPVIGFPVLIVLTYLLYGHAFAIVAHDVSFAEGLETTVDYATDGGDYAAFGIAHLVFGGVASLFLTEIVLNTGVAGVAVGTLLVAVPAFAVATYGVVLFRDLGNQPVTP